MPAPTLTRDLLAQLSREQLAERLRREVEGLSLAERFRLLHELGLYHAESLSGEGSSLAETRALRAALPRLLSRHGVRSLLDLPCGDFHWMRTLDLGGIDYLGADIVPEIVAANQARFAGLGDGTTGRRFQVLDAAADLLPAVDLILCRDLLIHLSLGDMRRVLASFRASGSRLLLTTHFASCADNVEIVSGDFRPVNLCAPPFGWPPPLEVVDEQSRMEGGAGRGLGLWRLGELRAE